MVIPDFDQRIPRLRVVIARPDRDNQLIVRFVLQELLDTDQMLFLRVVGVEQGSLRCALALHPLL
jgi:hypothetical protein